MMAYAVISQPKHEKTFPVFLEGPSQKKVSATTLVEPHGLAPVVPPHASGGGTLRSIPYYAPSELRRVPSSHSSMV